MVGGARLMALAVEIRNLSFRFRNGPTVLSDVSLSIGVGERVAVIGPNGAGKSTLLFHLNGLLPETPSESPAVWIAGTPVVKPNFAAIRRMVGLLFQNPDDQLFCPTVGEDVAFGPLQHGLAEAVVAERVRTALESVDLAGFECRVPSELSLGEKKRACIAGLLASEPTVLALDEPTASLDPRSRRGVVNLLEKLPQSMIVATHDLALAKEACHRVIVLDGGIVRAEGEPSRILHDRELLLRHGLEA
jgi:cobalt/nickel transport system ATP-binding protein